MTNSRGVYTMQSPILSTADCDDLRKYWADPDDLDYALEDIPKLLETVGELRELLNKLVYYYKDVMGDYLDEQERARIDKALE